MIILLFRLLITLITAGAITTFLGYWVHWVFHQPWSLWFHRAHMNHHQIQYPPTDFFSNKYRDAGRDNTVILFIVAFAPIIFTITALTFFGVLSLTTGGIALIGLIVWGLLHNYIHDEFHLTNSRMNNIKMFETWRKLHYLHHVDMSLNFGIISFAWDKLFKTYNDASNINLEK